MDQRVQIVIELMRHDLRHPLELEDLARYVNLSSSRLQHLFKTNMNVSPSQYLKGLRLWEAKGLIEDTFLRGKEVRAKVGIRDDSHFVRDFKRVFGCTPVEYRAKHGIAGTSTFLPQHQQKRPANS